MAIIIWPLLIAVLGAFVYALSSNAKAAELGRIAFFCGLLWVVYLLTDRTFQLG